ncbi:MAG: hypothetical protein FWH08_03715 [Oscillospiraceae bacterium]|nr:hypothetical protein [Oscillospiraceae bacterium]
MTNRTVTIPDEAIHRLARCLLPEVVKYFECEQGKREFAEWKAKQRKSAEAA